MQTKTSVLFSFFFVNKREHKKEQQTPHSRKRITLNEEPLRNFSSRTHLIIYNKKSAVFTKNVCVVCLFGLFLVARCPHLDFLL